MVTPTYTDSEPVETMDLTGGDVSLDFVNTASGRAAGPLQEKLHTYDDLVTWAERVHVLEKARGRRLRAEAARSPREAEAVLERARVLREALYRLFAGRGSAADLERLADEAGLAAKERRVLRESRDYRYAWPATDRLDQLLWPAAMSGADLLTSGDRRRVKECASDNCSWLFLDMSRNGSRRWCDMKVCGNRAKARRFSARHRGE